MFFDYVYYRICRFYDKNKSSSPGITGLCILSLTHYFNILSIFFILSIAFERKFDISKWLGVLLYAILLFINGLRYNKLNYGFLKKKWENENGDIIKKNNFVIPYILGSTALFAVLAIYIGSSYHKN
jgi:hypothetical protein